PEPEPPLQAARSDPSTRTALAQRACEKRTRKWLDRMASSIATPACRPGPRGRRVCTYTFQMWDRFDWAYVTPKWDRRRFAAYTAAHGRAGGDERSLNPDLVRRGPDARKAWRRGRRGPGQRHRLRRTRSGRLAPAGTAAQPAIRRQQDGLARVDQAARRKGPGQGRPRPGHRRSADERV